jgi:hypothetical protein
LVQLLNNKTRKAPVRSIKMVLDVIVFIFLSIGLLILYNE